MSNENRVIIEAFENKLEKGKTYTLKIDIKYRPAELCLDDGLPEKFVKKYSRKIRGNRDYVVFPKGTKFKFVGGRGIGFDDYFTVDGEKVFFPHLGGITLDAKDLNDYSEMFKEL